MSVFVFVTNLDKNLIKIISIILANKNEQIIKNIKYKTGLSDNRIEKYFIKSLLYIKFKLSKALKSNKK